MKKKNRIFLIPEAVYDQRATAVIFIYCVNEALHDCMTQYITGSITKRDFLRMSAACQLMKDKADELFESIGFPKECFSENGNDFEPMKAKEVFVNEILNMGEEPPADDDEQDCDDDDYFDYDDEDADSDGGLTYMEVERMCDRLYELKEDAANSVVQSADLLKTTDELLEALEEIKYRLDR